MQNQPNWVLLSTLLIDQSQKQHGSQYNYIVTWSFPGTRDTFGFSGSVLTSPEKYENGFFTLKTHQMFFVQTTPEKFKTTQQSRFILDVFDENAGKEITRLSWRHRFRKAPFSDVLHPRENAKPAFFDSPVFDKLRFHDGLVWTVGLTVKIKLRFQISRPFCGRGIGMPALFPNKHSLNYKGHKDHTFLRLYTNYWVIVYFDIKLNMTAPA